MKGMNRFFGALLIGAALALPGCDTGGGIMAGIDRGGVTGGAVGTISGFGSVIVNGVHYETTGADITVNGLPATEADLEVGYFVVVSAEVPEDGSAPSATAIEFSHDVTGPLASIDVAQNRFVILGQTIDIDDATLFGPGIAPVSADGLATLPAMQFVRVSGLPRADGTLLASRIELGPAGVDFEVKGVVSSVDAAASTLVIGSLVVDFSGATVEGFDAGQPAAGDRAKVKGEQFGAGGELIVQSLEREEIELSLDDGDQLEVEGLITAFASASSFSVSGIPVATGAQTEFENGTAAMLGLDVRVEVEGTVDGNGVLNADEVEFELAGAARVEALVESVDPAGGSLVVLGITIRTDASTSFEDQSPAELQPFGLQDIGVGDPVKVRGIEEDGAPGTLLATRVQRTESLEELEIRGIATDVAEPQFAVLGQTVLTDAQTDIDTDFFATADGRLVHVEGDTATGSFLAEKAEIKD